MQYYENNPRGICEDAPCCGCCGPQGDGQYDPDYDNPYFDFPDDDYDPYDDHEDDYNEAADYEDEA